MEQKTRLKRTLSDVSHFFISEDESRGNLKPKIEPPSFKNEEKTGQSSWIGFASPDDFPASLLVSSFFCKFVKAEPSTKSGAFFVLAPSEDEWRFLRKVSGIPEYLHVRFLKSTRSFDLFHDAKLVYLPGNVLAECIRGGNKEKNAVNRGSASCVFSLPSKILDKHKGMLRFLDIVYLVSRPTIEDLTECYKIMKAARSINDKLKFSLFLDGDMEPDRRQFLHRAFSGIAERHLGCPVSFGGYSSIESAVKKQEGDANILNCLKNDFFFASHESGNADSLVRFKRALFLKRAGI